MRTLVSRAIMKFVPRGQRLSGEEPHPLDTRQEPLQGCGPVSSTVIGPLVAHVNRRELSKFTVTIGVSVSSAARFPARQSFKSSVTRAVGLPGFISQRITVLRAVGRRSPGLKAGARR